MFVPLLHEKKPSSPSCQALIHIRTVVCETRAPNEATRYALILLYPHDRALANDEIASSFRSRHENLTKISSDFETSSATSAACLSAITRARLTFEALCFQASFLSRSLSDLETGTDGASVSQLSSMSWVGALLRVKQTADSATYGTIGLRVRVLLERGSIVVLSVALVQSKIAGIPLGSAGHRCSAMLPGCAAATETCVPMAGRRFDCTCGNPPAH